MHRQFAGVVTLLARLLIVPVFALAAFRHITDFAATKAAAARGFANVGITLPDGMVAVLAGVSCALLVIGCLCLLLGWQARVGALCLALYLIGVTPTLHAFWTASGEARWIEESLFMRNLAILGGVLIIMAFGAGPLSMDAAKAARRK
jgi:putative oxidoreductase